MDNSAILEKNNKENYIRNLNASNEAERLRQQIDAHNKNIKNFNNNLMNNNSDLRNNLNKENLNNGFHNKNTGVNISNNSDIDGINSRGYNATGKNGINPNSYSAAGKNLNDNISSDSKTNNKSTSINSSNTQTNSTTKETSNKSTGDALTHKLKNGMKKKNPVFGLMDKIMGGEKQEEEEENTMTAVFKVPIKVIKVALISSGPVFSIIIFCCLLISASQIYLNSIGIGNADNVSDDYAEKTINDVKEGKLDNEVKDTAYIEINTEKSLKFKNIKLQSNLVKTSRRPYNEAELEDLKDFYPEIETYGDKDFVYDFYLKMHDLYNTYYIDKGVKIDLPLLMATLRVQSTDMYEVFNSNVSKEDKNRYMEKDTSKRDMSNFKYDKDWSDYITTKTKSEHDMEVLAQNMFSNNATETCTDKSGKVTKKNIIRDDEIGTVVLECDVDETYNVTDAKFGKDEEKYKEFLKQFLEKKYYLDKEVPLNVKPSVKPTTDNNQSSGSSSTTPSTGNDNNQTTKPNQSNGDYRNWKQCGGNWGNMYMPGSSYTMCQWGCLATSLAIQIARSGTYVKETPFNPGVAIKYFNFSGGAYIWGSEVNIAPNFTQVSEFNLRGMSREAIVKKLNEYNKEKYYMILQIPYENAAGNAGTHYVAVDYIDIENNEIIMLDPARNTNPKLFEVYKYPNYVIVYERKD